MPDQQTTESIASYITGGRTQPPAHIEAMQDAYRFPVYVSEIVHFAPCVTLPERA
jgi:hypothetical protein